MAVTPATNVEAWRLVRDGIASGLTTGQIAARYDLSRAMVYHWSRTDRPPQSRPLGFTRGASARRPVKTCERCGRSACGSNGVAGRHCEPCIRAIERERTHGYVERLREHAATTGMVPTVNEAAAILGMGRSRAGGLVIDAFGPDPRPPGQARHSRRPWPPA